MKKRKTNYNKYINNYFMRYSTLFNVWVSRPRTYVYREYNDSSNCPLRIRARPDSSESRQVRPFLEKGYMARDDNEILLTSLGTDLNRKLVVVGDLSLYFTLQQDSSCFEDVRVEILSEFPKGRKWYY